MALKTWSALAAVPMDRRWLPSCGSGVPGGLGERKPDVLECELKAISRQDMYEVRTEVLTKQVTAHGSQN